MASSGFVLTARAKLVTIPFKRLHQVQVPVFFILWKLKS